MHSLAGSTASSPTRIKVRDLNHIQSFASEEVLTRSRHGSRHSLRGKQEIGQQYGDGSSWMCVLGQSFSFLSFFFVFPLADNHANNYNVHLCYALTGRLNSVTSLLGY